MAHDYDHEPVRGLPEAPPEGERILWQGAPSAISLARHALNAGWIAGYFAALAIWRGSVVGVEDGFAAGVTMASWFAAIGLIAVGVLALMAWVMAKATVYTITNRRIAMRIGAALTVTLNLPYRWINSADLTTHRDGTGTIALDLRGETRFSYLVLWPHVRPWVVNRTQPALRCIPEPDKVAALIAEAAAIEVAEISVGAAAAQETGPEARPAPSGGWPMPAE
jgi:hypothetical protein